MDAKILGMSYGESPWKNIERISKCKFYARFYTI